MSQFLLYNRPVVAGVNSYFVGMVTSGSTVGYLQSDNPSMSGATFVPMNTFHAGITVTSGLQEVNGVLFIPSITTTNPGLVSVDGGVTWQTQNVNLSFTARTPQEPFTWNGTHYYRFNYRSLDGISWTSVPNQPDPTNVPNTVTSRATDGYIMMHYTSGALSGNTYYSTDNAATWVLGGSLGGFAWLGYIATNGTRTWGVNNGDGAAYTDNWYQSRTSNGTGPGGHRLYKNGTWLGLRTNDIRRVTGTNTAWTLQKSLTASASTGQIFEWHGSSVYCFERKATSFDIQESVDDGVTWNSLGNITGYTPSVWTGLVYVA